MKIIRVRINPAADVPFELAEPNEDDRYAQRLALLGDDGEALWRAYVDAVQASWNAAERVRAALRSYPLTDDEISLLNRLTPPED